MIKKSMILTIMLSQGLILMACENSQVRLNRSNGDLRRSQGPLSKSQEIRASRDKVVIASLYYESPCSRRLSDVKREMMPVPPYQYHSDYP